MYFIRCCYKDIKWLSNFLNILFFFYWFKIFTKNYSCKIFHFLISQHFQIIIESWNINIMFITEKKFFYQIKITTMMKNYVELWKICVDINHNSNWPYISDHPYRILIIRVRKNFSYLYVHLNESINCLLTKEKTHEIKI